jgi:hypothetical protein
MTDKSKAILSINPDAEFTITDGVIEWLNGTAEISDADIQAKITELNTAEANEATAKATAKASGNTKLLDLGLSQEEATALTGYTPPEEE